jgi:hypothetical protein
MFRILKRRVDDAEILTAIECFIFFDYIRCYLLGGEILLMNRFKVSFIPKLVYFSLTLL